MHITFVERRHSQWPRNSSPNKHSSFHYLMITLKKLKKKGTVDHARGNGRPKKITGSASKIIGQSIRRNDSIFTRTLAQKMSNMGVDVSHMTISRHLANYGYSKVLPKVTPMLIEAHKQRRVEWARQHLNDNWRKTLFSDETAFQLYRNVGTKAYGQFAQIT